MERKEDIQEDINMQPCDWYEHDINNQYVIDVFGRTQEGKVACLRIHKFKPTYYLRSQQKPNDYSTNVSRYDVFAGFQDLKQVEVWKVECDSKAIFNETIKNAKGVLYESNLPPFLRMFHERHIGPGSAIQFKKKPYSVPTNKDGEQLYNIDEFYQCDVSEVEPAPELNIPLLVACYDLEVYSSTGLFPQAKNDDDAIIQIGISYRWSNDMLTPVRKVVFVVGTVTPSDDPEVEFVSCKDEEDMLFKYAYEIRSENPDIICGYNIFGFDDSYIEDRCDKLGIKEEIDLSRYPSRWKDASGVWKVKFSETKKFELASGKYDLRFLTLRGRLEIDLLLNMRREHSLDSFKLDNVASVFLKDKVLDYKDNIVTTKSTRGLRVGNYVRFDIVGNTIDPYRDGEKFMVTEMTKNTFKIQAPADLFIDIDLKYLQWTFSKDDVEPHELFRLHREGGPEGRHRIAKYCIQDCDLVLTLMAKLDTIVNARGMADVCKVPMDYVLKRGQGIKIYSAVVYYASQRNQIIQTQAAFDGDTGYEGAIVLPPKIGMYLDQPVSVLDFNSLYPTNMISYNLSPDTLVCEREFDTEGRKLRHEGMKIEEMNDLKEKGYILEDIEYDVKGEKGEITGKIKCTYVQPNDNPMTVGVLPKTLDILLKKRKEFKEKMEDIQYDEAQRSVFNGLQLAYKVVANSVYGQTGSRCSPIRKLCVAACTTAAGRKAIHLAKSIVENEYGASVIYGDTDSIFIKFPTQDLSESIRLGIDAGKRITSQCRRPYKIAYEKTFYPFILFCRKRYVGMMYEEDPNAKPKRKEMGIVLKRRDNAPIVKDVFGGALDILMKERDVKKAQQFTNTMLLNVLNNTLPLEKYIVSKSLRDDYITTIPTVYLSKLNEELEIEENKKEKEQNKNKIQELKHYLRERKATYNVLREWSNKYDLNIVDSSIAHRKLADRMEERDPGTAPKVGDRLQYVYVAEKSNGEKQGDRIEEISFVKSHNMKPDTQFYITNQIQKPLSQLFALCIDQLDGYIPPRKPSYGTIMTDMLQKYDGDEEEAMLAVLAKKEKQLDTIMFLNSPTLSKIIKKNVKGPMDMFVRR